MKVFFIVWACFNMLTTFSLVSAQEIYGNTDAPLVAAVLGTKIYTGDPDEMRHVILAKLLDQYAEDHDIEVKPVEIDAYVESLHRVTERDRKRHEDRRQELDRKLKSTSLTDPERKSLASELDTVNEFLYDIEEMTKSAGKNPDESRQYREQVAAAFIRQWKINRSLYKQYGGRVIFQQGGPEPLDAYRTFLQEHKKKGAFTILDKAFEEKFWEYYLTDAKHSFYPKGSSEEKQVFETPWWLTAPREEQ
jgi:hypothetical protein